jgi:hypothetical protein
VVGALLGELGFESRLFLARGRAQLVSLILG